MTKARTPILATARCHLTTWQAEDWHELAVLTSDSEMMRYISHGKPWPDDRCKEFVTRQMAQQDEFGFCTYRMTVGDDRALAGVCGLQPTAAFGGIELTWWLARPLWGGGLAFECAQAVAAHGFSDLELGELLAIIDKNNAASCRIAEKLGMTVRDEVNYAGFRVLVFVSKAPLPERLSR